MKSAAYRFGVGLLIGWAPWCVNGQQVGGDPNPNGAVVGGEKFQPKRYGVEHYSKVWSKSPFDFEIRVEEEETEEENPFENLKLAGLIQRGGEFFVSVYDEKGDKGDRIRLRSGDEENEEGISIVRVERGNNYKETKIHVRKGDTVGVIEYDTKRIESKATGAVGGASRANQGGNQRGDARGTPGAGNPAGAAGEAPQGDAQKSAQEARNEVIKRLLEKAKQNQAGSQGGNSNSQPSGGEERKRRVVLPPPK